MAISVDEFKDALRKVVSSEFANIPEDENSIDYVFNEKFNKRMEKLIKTQRKAYWKFINTASKRIAIFCIVFIALFTTACSVKGIREPIVRFIIETHEKFNQYFFEGDTTDEISYEYKIKDIPEGFVQTDKFKNENKIITTYGNSTGEVIEFTQGITDAATFSLDTERGTITLMQFDSVDVTIYEGGQHKIATWIQDAYCFHLICYGNISVDTMKSIILSIE